MKELIEAQSAGFCFGVARSVELAETALSAGKHVYCLGELIHNREEVARLEAMGMTVVASTEEIPDGACVIVRSHGVKRSVISQLKTKNAEIIDATCPKVAHIHKIVSQAENEGRKVIIIGAENHPEVDAISGWCGDNVVISNDEMLEEYAEKHPETHDVPVALVFQTTQTKKVLEKCKKNIKKFYTNCKVFDTICFATQTRQAEAEQLSKQCDAMIVIGGKHSANSNHLAEICAENCSAVAFVENADELSEGFSAAYDTIGVTAGASVPAWIIKEVKQKMCDEIKTETMEEKSFAELLEDSIKTIYNGETVTGIVAAISNTEISVDLGTKHCGYIPTEDYTDAGIKVEDAVHIGDTVEAVVVRVNDREGTVELSKKRLDAVKYWAEIEEACEKKDVVEGVVTEENKGGVVVTVKGIRVFVPASMSGLPKDAEMSQLKGQTVRLELTEVNRSRKRVVGSIRAVAQRERRERLDKIWNEIEVGKRYEGTVKSLTSYGAFVDIGGVDGMVHVSELSWTRVTKPSEIVNVGDKIEVYVIAFDKENRKISLGYKDPTANPWEMFTSKYEVGSVATVKIVKLMTFGAFAEVVPGVDGLIHISQIANRRIGKPEDVLTVGEEVEAKITAIDEDKHKVSLSIRALSEPAPAPVQEEEVEEAPEAEEDALVYEVSADGEATGVAPEEE